MNLSDITLQVTEIVRAVGEFIRQQQQRLTESDVIEKGEHDLVTYVDKESESRLVSRLKQIVPDAGFIVEEDQQLEKAGKYNWIIDPLDGTTNFVHGVPVYSVSVALARKNELILGVVYEVNLDECFYAWKGGQAMLNGKPISVSKQSSLNDSLLATGFPYHDYSLMKPYLHLFNELMKSSRGIRRLGSAAVDLAYVACGRFEAFYEYGLNPWDVAAGALIVKQAGGLVTDFNNKDDYLFGRHILASNGHTHKAFLNKLNTSFKGYL
jgi:myo-inositol-1(or 4)-monophosphatase